MITYNCPEKHTNESSPSVAIIGREHWLEHGELKLYLWEKYQGDTCGKPVVVLAHGSATAGRESFDLQVPGKPSYSLMDYLAKEGFDVFAPDIRGFGRSTKPDGHMNSGEACADLDAVVNYIIALRGVKKVHLLVWSWGSQYGGMFVMAHPEKVARYISYAQMHVDSPDLVKRRPKIDMFRNTPYVTISKQGWKPRFFSMTPESVNDGEVIEAYAAAAAEIELKTPTGPQLDMVRIMPMVNARFFTVPTMVIHGEYDDVADLAGLFPFFAQLPNPDKRYVIVPDAGHMMHLQEGHRRFQYEVRCFLQAESR